MCVRVNWILQRDKQLLTSKKYGKYGPNTLSEETDVPAENPHTCNMETSERESKIKVML